LKSHFLGFMPIQSRYTYCKCAFGITKLRLRFFMVAMVVVAGVQRN
jgi:hypothetical protein